MLGYGIQDNNRGKMSTPVTPSLSTPLDGSQWVAMYCPDPNLRRVEHRPWGTADPLQRETPDKEGHELPGSEEEKRNNLPDSYE